MIVVDANVLLYAVIPSPSMGPLIGRVRKRDKDWRAPDLIEYELASVFAFYIRQNQLTLDESLRAYKRAMSLLIKSDFAPFRLPSVLNLAIKSSCTTYDCTYVAAAEAAETRLITGDKELLAAFPLVATSIEDFAAGK